MRRKRSNTRSKTSPTRTSPSSTFSKSQDRQARQARKDLQVLLVLQEHQVRLAAKALRVILDSLAAPDHKARQVLLGLQDLLVRKDHRVTTSVSKGRKAPRDLRDRKVRPASKARQESTAKAAANLVPLVQPVLQDLKARLARLDRKALQDPLDRLVLAQRVLSRPAGPMRS